MVELKNNAPKQNQTPELGSEVAMPAVSRAAFVALPSILREETEPEALGPDRTTSRQQGEATNIRILRGRAPEVVDAAHILRLDRGPEQVIERGGDGQEGQFNFQGETGHPLERVPTRDAGGTTPFSQVLRGGRTVEVRAA